MGDWVRPPIWTSRTSPPPYTRRGEIRDITREISRALFVPISKNKMLTLDILLVGRRRSGKSNLAHRIMQIIRSEYERHYPGRDLVQCIEAEDPAAWYDWAGKRLDGDTPGENWPQKKVWVLHVNDPMGAMFYSQRDKERIRAITDYWRFAHIMESRIGNTGIIYNITGPQTFTKLDNSFRSADLIFWKSTIDGEKRAFLERMSKGAYSDLQLITRDIYGRHIHHRRGDMICTMYGEEGLVHMDYMPEEEERAQYQDVVPLYWRRQEEEADEISTLKRWARRLVELVDPTAKETDLKRGIRSQLLLLTLDPSERDLLHDRLGDLALLIYHVHSHTEKTSREEAVVETVSNIGELISKKFGILSELEDREDRGDAGGFPWGDAVWAYRRNRARDKRVPLRDLLPDYPLQVTERTLLSHIDRVSGALFHRLGPMWEDLLARTYRADPDVSKVIQTGDQRQKKDRRRRLGDLVVYYQDGRVEVVGAKVHDSVHRPRYTRARSGVGRSSGSYAAEVEHAERIQREKPDAVVRVVLEMVDIFRCRSYDRRILELNRIPEDVRF